ncbi:hypothetical protein EPN83_03355 [Patescibacteria group bacterium]|nr:MAG: hypothetical protein EPN83_03355 [Patescibacteria group bacterium]
MFSSYEVYLSIERRANGIMHVRHFCCNGKTHVVRLEVLEQQGKREVVARIRYLMWRDCDRSCLGREIVGIVVCPAHP